MYSECHEKLYCLHIHLVFVLFLLFTLEGRYRHFVVAGLAVDDSRRLFIHVRFVSSSRSTFIVVVIKLIYTSQMYNHTYFHIITLFIINTCIYLHGGLWNCSLKGTLNKAHVSIKDTCSHTTVILYCIIRPLN